MLDPNSKIASAHEVRVTLRGVRLSPDGKPVQVSTRSDFIAPDQAPIPTTVIEQTKGLRGWTDYDKKPEDRRSAGVKAFEAKRAAQIKARAAAIVADTTCGTVIPRREVPTGKVVRRWR